MGSGGSVPSATASGPPRGEASASNVSRPRVRVIMRHLRPGETIARGVGEVAGADAPPVGAEHPSTEALTSEEHGWFVEDLEHFGQWEAYNEESTQRLEQAFLSQAEQCTVVMKKRTHVVSFATMQQLPSASSTAAGAKALPTRPRAVRRAPVEVTADPVTGVPTRRMKSSGVVDPFDQEDDPSTVEALAEGAEGESRVGETIISEVPALHCSLIVGSQPLYCMDLAPQCVSTPNGAVSMVVGSKEGTLLELSIDGLSSAISASYASKSPQNSTLSVLTAVYSASGQYIVSGGDDRIARLYRCGKSEPLQLLKGHQHKVYGAAVMLGDRKVVTGSMDATVCTWDVETGNCEISEHCHNSHVFAVKLSSLSPFLGLSAGDDMLLCLHDFRRPMSVVQRFRGHRKTIWDCDIRGDDGAFVSCGMDQTVRVWDPRISEKEMICMQQHYRPVHCARFTPKGTGVLSSAKDGYAYLSNAETGETVWRTKVHGATAYRALYSAKAKTLLTCSSDSSINAWKWDTKENW